MQIVESCEKRGAGISTSMFERCFPYVLLRNAYRALHKQLVASAAPPAAAAAGAARGHSPADNSARSDASAAAASAGDAAAAAAALATQSPQNWDYHSVNEQTWRYNTPFSTVSIILQ